jgi:hypothetical protein
VGKKSVGKLHTKVHKYSYFFCDNASAINLSKNPIQHSRSKHIEIKHHFIRDHDQEKNIALSFVDTENQLADFFTKSLVEDRFNFLKEKLLIMKNPNKDWLQITKGLRLNPLMSSDANQIDLSQSRHSSECSRAQNVPEFRMFIRSECSWRSECSKPEIWVRNLMREILCWFSPEIFL